MTDQRTEQTSRKTAWEPMVLTYVGHAADILRHGSEKLSATGGDPGEPRKQATGAHA